MCIILCTWIGTLLTLSMPRLMVQNKNEDVEVLSDTVQEFEMVSKLDSIKNALIEEVETYVYGKYTKTHKTIPSTIVEKGLENEVDIMFIMAQTQIETSFGTTGAGRETSRRSLFGVANKSYNSYEHAIDDYVKILRKYYLTNGRTEHHLMNKYTTGSGARYAENPNYEVELKGAYHNIKKKTKISELQSRYQELYLEESKTKML